MDLDAPTRGLASHDAMVRRGVAMQQSLFSALWYRVAEQHPRLRSEVRVQRQQVRGQRWYLLVNVVNGRQYRINERAYQFIGRCDGRRCVEEIWSSLLEQLGD